MHLIVYISNNVEHAHCPGTPIANITAMESEEVIYIYIWHHSVIQLLNYTSRGHEKFRQV